LLGDFNIAHNFKGNFVKYGANYGRIGANVATQVLFFTYSLYL